MTAQIFGRYRRPSIAVSTILIIVTVLFAWPVVMIVVGAFRTGTPGLSGSWSLESITATFGDRATGTTLLNSAVYTSATAIIAGIMALFFAFVVARTDTPLKGLVTPAMLIVLAVPPLFFGIGWVLAGGEYAGLLNQAVQWIGFENARPFNVESWPGLIFVSALKLTSLCYFLLLGPFLAMNAAQEEAALTAGAGKLRLFFTVTIPALAPAVLSTFVLALVLGLEFFDLPLILGTADGIEVFATQIYHNLNNFDPPNYCGSSALAIILIAVLAVLLFIQSRILAGRQFTTVSGKLRNRPAWNLGKWKWVTSAAIVAYLVLALALPVFQLVIGSMQSFLGIYQNFSLDNYTEIFNDPKSMSALQTTTVLALGCGLGVMVLALGITYVMRHFKGATERYVRMVTWLPWAVPGTALVLGIIWAYLSVPQLRFLYGSVTLLIIGLVIAATPIAVRSLEPAILQIGRELEEAAWTSGLPKGRAFILVTARLVLPSFIAGWVLAGLVIAGNLAVPLMLSNVDTQTVPVLALSLYNNGNQPKAAALFCLIAAVLVVGYLLVLLARRILVRIASATVRDHSSTVPIAETTPILTKG